MVFNATFNSISVISWRSVLLVEETGVPRYIYIYIQRLKNQLRGVGSLRYNDTIQVKQL